MRVFVIGANGQIGQHLIKKLGESERHAAIAMVRKEEDIFQFSQKGIITKLIDLEGSIDSTRDAIKETQADAVVFTAGSGGHTGADKTMLIDLDGAVKSMKAAKQAGVKRFVIVSAIGTHKWHEFKDHEDKGSTPSYYGAAKYYADAWLENSGLDYTIVRPGGLVNKPGTGKIAAAITLERGEIAREDVASTIVAVLENDHTIGKAFDVTGGGTLIREAIKSI